MRTQILFGVLGVILAALTAPASSAEDTIDPSTQREFGAKLLACGECHGENGVPKNAAIPIIWGQQQNYLLKQLHDFRSGDRNDEIMRWIANTLLQPEQGPAAANFAKKNWPTQRATAASTSVPQGITLCQACHQTNFLGAVQAGGVVAPRLAGQSYEYLVEEMRRFADGERNNDGDMVMIIKSISPADREAIARYLSGL